MTTGKHVALEPALKVMFAEHFHHSPICRDMVIDIQRVLLETSILDLEDGAETIRVRFVGTKEAKVRRIFYVRIAHHRAERTRRLMTDGSGAPDVHRVRLECGQN